MGRQTGFTLVELMLALVIAGILVAVAVPSYLGQVQRTRRVDAESALLSLATAMERHYTVNNRYTGAAGTAQSPADTGAPWVHPTQAPLDGASKFYDLTISQASAQGYTLSATPIVGAPQASDPCGTLTLSHTGVRGISGGQAGWAVADCWK